MQQRLALTGIEGSASRADDWRLDEHTKAIGREGLAAARQALADAYKRAAA